MLLSINCPLFLFSYLPITILTPLISLLVSLLLQTPELSFPIHFCLCFPSGPCSWVCPITLISLIYTWTSAAVRYALSVCTAVGIFTPLLRRLTLVAIPSCSTPLCLPRTVEVSRCRGDSGAVSSSVMCGDFRHI